MANNTGANPREVTSPRSNWQMVDVLHEADHWSMALGRWRSDEGDWRPVLAQRWNGWQGSKGNPISRGYPTWFVLPDETYGLYIESEFIPTDKRSFVRSFLELPKSGAAA
jgi:hypothetical protein